MVYVTERVKKETDVSVAEERRRWNQVAKAKARGKVVDESTAAVVSVHQKSVPSGFGQNPRLL